MEEHMTLRHWLALSGLTFAAFIFNTSEFVPIGLLTDIKEDFHLTEASVGMLISVYAWVVMLLSLPLMIMVSRMEMRRLMLWLIGLFGVCQVMSYLSGSYAMLMASRIGVACTHAIFWSIVAPMAVRMAPEKHKALALSMVVMLAAFFGFGGAKLRAKYNTARQWFTVGVAADNGYNLNEELNTRANTAANVITTGSNTLGADNAEVQAAQAALDDFSACLDAVQSGGKSQALTSLSYYNGSSMHALYQANETLGKAIDQLYAKLQEQAADPMKMGAVQGQYGQFNSAGTIIGTLKYNEAVYNYRNEVGGFPANVLGGLAGVKEVEPFA